MLAYLSLGKLQTLGVLLQRLKSEGHRYLYNAVANVRNLLSKRTLSLLLFLPSFPLPSVSLVSSFSPPPSPTLPSPSSCRVLLFTQMARILDVLEIFLNYHGHTYLRLDGATPPQKRQVRCSCTGSGFSTVYKY